MKSQTKDNRPLRERIFAVQDIEHKHIKVPQWGAEIDVIALTGEERARLIAGATDSKGEIDSDKLYYGVIVTMAHDPETGGRLFTDDDIPALKKKNGAAIEKIARAGFKLAGLGQPDMEELEKN